jgi:hypothetical protein
VTIGGYNIRLGFGADIRANRLLSVGGLVTGEIMGLTRPETNEAQGLLKDFYNLRGSSLAAGVTTTVGLSLHL